MKQFKVGDKVKRIAGSYHCMGVGDVGIVTALGHGGIKIKEFDQGYGYHDADMFELIDRTYGEPIDTAYMVDPDKFDVGAKYDSGKLLFRALTRGLAMPLRAVAAVLTYGAIKYKEDSWQQVPNAKTRYESALDRHLNDWKRGEVCDPESGLPHLAHAACNALFLLWFELQDYAGDYTAFKEPPNNG